MLLVFDSTDSLLNTSAFVESKRERRRSETPKHSLSKDLNPKR